MDTISHGLWAIVLVKGFFKKTSLWLSFLFGILPDIIPFGIPFIQMVFSGFSFSRDHAPQFVPGYTHFLYNFTHSLIIVLLVFLAVYLFKKKIYFFMLGWPLHILIDIPTHSKEFFPTPFLYPLASVSIDGISWGNPYIFFTNWILLIILLVVVFRKEIKEKIKHAHAGSRTRIASATGMSHSR